MNKRDIPEDEGVPVGVNLFNRVHQRVLFLILVLADQYHLHHFNLPYDSLLSLCILGRLYDCNYVE